jgi:hypothetical protein
LLRVSEAEKPKIKVSADLGGPLSVSKLGLLLRPHRVEEAFIRALIHV